MKSKREIDRERERNGREYESVSVSDDTDDAFSWVQQHAVAWDQPNCSILISNMLYASTCCIFSSSMKLEARFSN